jgi:hypothetical protein
VFGSALNPDPVRIHRAKYWALHPAWITMAPDGHLWFHPNGDSYADDFSIADVNSAAHFIHEMVHVWQHQCGIDLRWQRPPWARYRYLPLRPGRPFARYGLEQQAEIVREAWLLRCGLALPGRPPLAQYDALLPFGPD